MARPAPAVGTAAVLDVETAGFSPRSDEIIKLPMILFRYDRVVGQVVETVGDAQVYGNRLVPSRGALIGPGDASRVLTNCCATLVCS